MSSVDKLFIQGIRSFGSGDADKAVIQFYTPLTLITGQNGAGKTTIIECLKYVTTGELPPNGKSGAFVHDPKLAGEREVKGVVKLKFTDMSGNTAVCHRMLQSTQKPHKIEQRTLDSSLEKVIGGQKVAISSRCAEVDRELIVHLGVSKAILNHVIFCHQEESAWPLSEGKALKTKFDEIFASTRYTKALENIKQIRGEHDQNCKLFNKDLEHLKLQKTKAEELQEKMKEMQQKVDASKADVTRIKNELAPQETRLQELNDMYEEVSSLERTIAELDSSKRELQRSCNNLDKKIEQKFTGSFQELQDFYHSHHIKLEKDERELTQLENRNSQLQRDEEQVKRQMSVLHRKHGELETEDRHHRNRVKSRDSKLHSLASELGLKQFTLSPVAGGCFSPKQVSSFLSKAGQHVKELEDKDARDKARYTNQERALQRKIDELNNSLATHEQTRKLKRETLKKNKMEVASIAKELSRISSSAGQLEDTEEELKTAEKQLKEYLGSINVSKMRSELNSMSVEKRKVDEKAKSLQRELGQLSMQSSARGALEALKKDKRDKERAHGNELNVLEEEVSALDVSLDTKGPGDLSKKLYETERSKKKESEKASVKLNQLNQKVMKVNMEEDTLRKQLKAKQSRLKDLESEVGGVVGERSYEDLLQGIEEECEKLRDDISVAKGSAPFFKKSLGKLKQSKKCPMCLRGFSTDGDYERLVVSVTDRLNKVIPRIVPQLEEKLQTKQKEQRELQELAPKVEDISTLKGRIPQLESELRDTSKSKSQLQREQKEANSENTRLLSELDKIRGLQPKVTRVDTLQKDINSLNTRIQLEQSKLTVGDSSRNQMVVNRELQDAQRKSEDLSTTIDRRRQEIDDHNSQLKSLEDSIHRLKEEKLNLQGMLQTRQTLISKKEDLLALNGTLGSEIESVEQALAPLQEELEERRKEKRKLTEEKETAEVLARTKMQELRTQVDSIHRSTDTIKSYIEEKKTEALEECVSQLGELKTEVDTKAREKRSLEEKIKLLQKQKANAKVREHELEDNIELMVKQQEVVEKEQQVKKAKSELRSKGLDQYDTEYQRLQSKVETLRKEQARVEGHRQGQEEQVRHFERELQGGLYKDVVTRHTSKLVELTTTKLAVSDLDKFYRALDRAITRYHTIKMEEINKIIKEIWIKTYRGGDIDTIEIRSDDETVPDTGPLRTRKVYHYRVVMKKGEVSLDMRGRCSAGQKVLASIIIRLALAEVFCLNFGLMALDEPTTNLDRENMEGLAQAITDIVSERSKQKNFQLIVITHDEEFVQLLSQSDYTEYYYKVSKEVEETSRVRRFHISGLNS